MKKKMAFSMAFGLVFMFSEAAVAQTVKVDGEIRTRSEYRSGFKTPLPDSISSTLVTTLRTKLNLSYSSEKISARVSLLDTRNYGSTNLSSTGSTLGVFEAWGAYAVTPEFSVKLGRQVLEYDDKRLISGSNWSNTPSAHDAALFTYEKKDFKAHLATEYNNTSADELTVAEYKSAAPYKYMTFAWLAKTISNVNATALWVNNGFQRGTTYDLVDKLIFRNTVGTNLDYSDKNLPVSAYATAYYQFGHDADNKSLRAYLLALKLKGNLDKTLALTLGGDYISGSKYNIDSKKSRKFNKLFGANHIFNGYMEYWSTLPERGLVDLYGAFTYTPNKKWNVDATFHSFSFAQQYSATNTKKALGSELDLTAIYTVSPVFQLQGGWSHYFSNDLAKTYKKVAGETKSNWTYIMLTFKPKFL